MTSYTLRIDENDKKAASAVAEYYGFDLASVTRAFYKQMIRTHSIPLDLGGEQPNAESLEAIREAQEIIDGKRPHEFRTADDMFSALGI